MGVNKEQPSDGGVESDGYNWSAPLDGAAARLRSSVRRALGGAEPQFDPYSEVTLPPGVESHPTRETVLSDVHDWFVDAEPAPQPGDLSTRLFDFSYLADHEEMEWYWVDEPFAYVSVLRDEGELRYRVTEPALSEFESYVRDELTKVLRNSLMYQDLDDDEVDVEALFRERAKDLIDEHIAAVDPVLVHKLLYYLTRDFLRYERIDPILRDQAVEDISCDGAGVPVFVYHREYRDVDTNVRFDDDDLRSFVVRMAQRAGKHLSVSNPLVDASLPDGSRVQLTFGGDVATRGPNFTVRQFSSVPDTPLDLIRWGTFTVPQMAYFWLAIESNRSLLFAGGTGSGKTTSLNAVSFFVPKKSKIVTIEDTREITLPHENWIQSLTRDTTSGGEGVTMYEQLQAALRQRPEYLLVGEIRTQRNVALTFFQAMATGHTAYTTLHSESVQGVINRLENDPLGVPTEMIKELDIISIQKQVKTEDGRVRRNDRVTELIAGEELRASEVFRWEPTTDTYNDRYDSKVMESVAEDRGWNDRRLRKELDDRERVLRYMLDNDVTWYEDVAAVIHAFIADQERVVADVEADDLDPREYVKDYE